MKVKEAIAILSKMPPEKLQEIIGKNAYREAVDAMLDACKCAEANLSPSYSSYHIVMRKLRDAIARAEALCTVEELRQ